MQPQLRLAWGLESGRAGQIARAAGSGFALGRLGYYCYSLNFCYDRFYCKCLLLLLLLLLLQSLRGSPSGDKHSTTCYVGVPGRR